MAQEYNQLLAAYRRMFGMIDAFHFNSQNTADVYARYLSVPAESKVIPITHSGIKDHRRIKVFDGDVLRLGFIGSEAPYKGLPLLRKVIGELNQEGFKDALSLVVYGGRTGEDKEHKNIYYKGHFTSAMMEDVFSKMDLLLVPSIWNETFSLVALEAISYGTPVLVSDKVGAKDIVEGYDVSFVYHTEDELRAKLEKLVSDKSELIEYNRRILSMPWQHDMREHAKEIVEKLYGCKSYY